MQDFNNILLSQLRDIYGLHGVSVFPLAPGWWLLIFLMISSALVVSMKILKIKRYKKSWRYDLEQELNNIIADKDPENSKSNISRINEILKRLSIQLYGREDSASLSGKKWLMWLTNRDPNNFNWLKKAELLLDYPYMKKESAIVTHEQIVAMAKAAKPWLKL